LTAPAAILRDLVAISSVSSESNRPLVEWIKKVLEPLGWYQRIYVYQDENGIEKNNLIVSPWPMEGATIEIELAIVCHTDTVPYDATWKDAMHLREQDGSLHGCGACDVKGFLACMLAAVFEVDTSLLSKNFCLVFTADEEIGCRGARFLLEQQSFRARYAIVGEPTSLLPARAGKGYCLAKISIIGKSAHSAFPDAGRSAIFAAARLLREIETLAQEMTAYRNEAFSPPWTTLNIGEIHGGTAKNIVPALCSMLLEWRPIPGQEPAFVLDCLHSILDRLAAEDATFVSEVQVLRMDEGFETDATNAVIQAVLLKPNTESRTISFGTEAPWMAKMGADVVVIGPGSMQTAHSPRECVPVTELEDCTHLLRTALKQLCL
jgi:acetylornithine deacetylase